MNKKLLDLYDQIPKFKCVEGCTDCCGPTLWLRAEWEAVRDKREATGLKCPYANSGCDIYDQRPFICRVFGASDLWVLKCPRGAGPENPLTATEARRLAQIYNDMIDD